VPGLGKVVDVQSRWFFSILTQPHMQLTAVAVHVLDDKGPLGHGPFRQQQYTCRLQPLLSGAALFQSVSDGLSSGAQAGWQ
jgi:hypothetical protein